MPLVLCILPMSQRGKTALDCAKGGGHTEIVAMLEVTKCCIWPRHYYSKTLNYYKLMRDYHVSSTCLTLSHTLFLYSSLSLSLSLCFFTVLSLSLTYTVSLSHTLTLYLFRFGLSLSLCISHPLSLCISHPLSLYLSPSLFLLLSPSLLFTFLTLCYNNLFSFCSCHALDPNRVGTGCKCWFYAFNTDMTWHTLIRCSPYKDKFAHQWLNHVITGRLHD